MTTAFGSQPIRSVRDRTFAPGLIVMAVVLVVTLIVFVLNSDLTLSFPYLYLLPWIIGLTIVFSIPMLVLYRQGKLTLFNPLVFAAWSYFFPAFIIGGFMLTAGWSQPYFLSFIQDAEYNLPYTTVLIALGFSGLALGYFSPFGSRAGSVISDHLPKLDYASSALIIPGIFLLILGILNSAAALALGIIGYQKADVIESYEGIVFLTTLFWLQGTFLLWFIIFKRGRVNIISVSIGAFLFIASISKALLSGNRAGLLQVFIVFALAFLLSGRTLNVKQTVTAAGVMLLCLVVGMVYGTTFRNLKGSESQVSIDRYTDNIFDTFDEVSKFNLKSSLEFGLMGLAERLDTLSSVAVVVSNYEELEPYEESYGLDNNIWKDLSTFFIPRVVWTEKPVASEPRKYSDLYFNYGENSFAITPMGDLLRNYGPYGVPIGMFLFGIVIRFIYRSLIEDQPRLIWRSTLYFMLLMAISYEGFYGLLIPLLFKVGITAIIGLLIVSLIAKSMGIRATLTPV